MTGPQSIKAGSDYARQALLPEGFRDQLAPQAEHEASLVRGLMDCFLSYGYDRVAPPVVEYEGSLLVGAGATRANSMFRVMDPDTQSMMAVRADMTVQISRLAATRLSDSPRPLRLSYTGNVLRTKGSQVRPARQFVQAGIELIGSNSLEAEFEVVKTSVEALAGVGIEEMSIDLTLAPLLPMMADTHGLPDDIRRVVFDALNSKDKGGLAVLADAARSEFEALLSAAGPAEQAMAILKGMQLKGAAGQLIARLGRLVDMIESKLPSLQVTVDACESHGFEYKSGIGFALFAKGNQSELGRGGRYLVVHPDGHTEEAAGFSVYMDSLVAALPTPENPEKLFLPYGTSDKDAVAQREAGWRTIQGLTDEADTVKEARRLGCSHVLKDGQISAV